MNPTASPKQTKVIFIHIPKTAGESISQCLLENTKIAKISPLKSQTTTNQKTLAHKFNSYRIALKNPQVVVTKIAYQWKNKLNPQLPEWLYLDKHQKAREFKKCLGDKTWDDCFSFSFVRNPWDLVVSLYNHLRKPLYVDKNKLAKQYPEFLTYGYLEPQAACKAAMEYDFNDWVIQAYGEEKFPHYGWFDNQFSWLSDGEKIIVDFVGRYERLDRDWEHIGERLGIKQKLPNLNSSHRRPYQTYYSSETKELIGQKFETDIINFNYEF